MCIVLGLATNLTVNVLIVLTVIFICNGNVTVCTGSVLQNQNHALS